MKASWQTLFFNRLRKQVQIFSTWVIMVLITLGLMILVLVLSLIQPIWRARSKIRQRR